MSKRAADFSPNKKDLNPIEIASRDEIAALQLRRMKWSLKHAYETVPHYRKSFDAAGVHPDDLKDLSDLRKFPFTSKDDLRANYPYGMFAVPMDKIVRVHASSGTTGKPTVVGYTALDKVVNGLTSSGVVSAASNRRAFRITQEPLDMCRNYFAVYAREQASCHFSPALIANLEKYWNAQNRKP